MEKIDSRQSQDEFSELSQLSQRGNPGYQYQFSSENKSVLWKVLLTLSLIAIIAIFFMQKETRKDLENVKIESARLRVKNINAERDIRELKKTLVQPNQSYVEAITYKQKSWGRLKNDSTQGFVTEILKEDSPASQKQKKSVSNFQCKADYFSNFNQKAPFITKKNHKLIKVPYPQLILVQEQKEHPPVNHYQELAVYIQNHQTISYIYVRSAPLYALLILAAASSDETMFILSHSFCQQKAAKLLFVLNNIKPKLIIEKESDKQQNISKADLVVISDNDWEIYNNDKKTLLLINYRKENFSPQNTYKLISSSVCGLVSQKLFSSEVLTPGSYIVK